MPIIADSGRVGTAAATPGGAGGAADGPNTMNVGPLSPPEPAATKALMKAPVVPLYRSTWAVLRLAM